MAMGVGLDPHSRTTDRQFSRDPEGIPPLVFEVGDLAICIYPRPKNRPTDNTSGRRCEFGDNRCTGHTCPTGLKVHS